MEDNPSWKDLIKLKYGLEEGGWFSAKPKEVLGWVFGRILKEKLSS